MPYSRNVTNIKAFMDNPHDSKAIKSLIDTARSLPKEVIYDRGKRDKKTIDCVKITTPKQAKSINSPCLWHRFLRQDGIKTVFNRLKKDHQIV